MNDSFLIETYKRYDKACADVRYHKRVCIGAVEETLLCAWNFATDAQHMKLGSKETGAILGFTARGAQHEVFLGLSIFLKKLGVESRNNFSGISTNDWTGAERKVISENPQYFIMDLIEDAASGDFYKNPEECTFELKFRFSDDGSPTITGVIGKHSFEISKDAKKPDA